MWLSVVALSALLGASGELKGQRLPEGASCYVISSNRSGQAEPIGVTFQTVRRGVSAGRSVLFVSVRQRAANGRFDMRDDFVLDAKSLRPVSLTNRSKGVVRAEVSYGVHGITGRKLDASGQWVAMDVPLQGPVWEGNLFGLTFAALPLAKGRSFEIPFWQYDKGFGVFDVKVTATEVVQTPDGPREAWSLDVKAGSERTLTYVIGKTDHRELGYRAAQGAQTLGGDCSAISSEP